MEHQQEFSFSAGPASHLHPPDPRAQFYDEVAAAWHLPCGRMVRVDLKDHDLAGLQGLLELSRAPDLPLDPRQPLALRIGTVEFSSRQITGWSLT